jgi:hypothetical protein
MINKRRLAAYFISPLSGIITITGLLTFIYFVFPHSPPAGHENDLPSLLIVMSILIFFVLTVIQLIFLEFMISYLLRNNYLKLFHFIGVAFMLSIISGLIGGLLVVQRFLFIAYFIVGLLYYIPSLLTYRFIRFHNFGNKLSL